MARTSPAHPDGRLRELHFNYSDQFSFFSNALIDVRERIGADGRFSVILSDGPRQVTFFVRRRYTRPPPHLPREVNATHFQVPILVVDDDGEWPTFVGAGPGAFEAPGSAAPRRQEK